MKFGRYTSYRSDLPDILRFNISHNVAKPKRWVINLTSEIFTSVIFTIIKILSIKITINCIFNMCFNNILIDFSLSITLQFFDRYRINSKLNMSFLSLQIWSVSKDTLPASLNKIVCCKKSENLQKHH